VAKPSLLTENASALRAPLLAQLRQGAEAFGAGQYGYAKPF